SYSKLTPAVGFHFACSFPKPFFAYALNKKKEYIPSVSPYSLASSSLCLDVTGSTLGSLDLKSAVVTCLVCSSVHLTSRVNSTLHSGQKSMHWQSLLYPINSHSRSFGDKDTPHAIRNTDKEILIQATMCANCYFKNSSLRWSVPVAVISSLLIGCKKEKLSDLSIL
ncbi:hypothetical protein ALC56_03558, partial [Trachymyrmex septentrionalis]